MKATTGLCGRTSCVPLPPADLTLPAPPCLLPPPQVCGAEPLRVEVPPEAEPLLLPESATHNRPFSLKHAQQQVGVGGGGRREGQASCRPLAHGVPRLAVPCWRPQVSLSSAAPLHSSGRLAPPPRPPLSAT